MIVKCMSRKSNVDLLIRYIFRDEKFELPDKKVSTRSFNPQGIELTQQDKHHLAAEVFDSVLLQAFREFKGSLQDFISQLSGTTSKQGIETRFPIVIKQNIRSRTVKGYTKEFEENERFRQRLRKDSVLAYHTVISFSSQNKEQVTTPILKDIANTYVSLRGRDSLFIGTVHYDRDHIHMHIVMSGTKYITGRSNRISKADFQKLKIELQEYQKEKYPQLQHSLPEHGKSKKNGRAYAEKNKTHERTKKYDLQQLLETAYSKADSLQNFLSEVQHHGHVPYYRNGKLQGIKYDGITKYRLNRLGYDEKTLNMLDKRKEKETNELSELKSLRQNERSRTVSRPLMYEDIIKGMNDDEIRKYQQELVDNKRDFELRHNLNTSSIQENELSDYEKVHKNRAIDQLAQLRSGRQFTERKSKESSLIGADTPVTGRPYHTDEVRDKYDDLFTNNDRTSESAGDNDSDDSIEDKNNADTDEPDNEEHVDETPGVNQDDDHSDSDQPN